MKGIYKITSPSGKTYIGQSTNIPVRFSNYKSVSPVKAQRKLYNSFIKYGVENHLFEIVYELPSDVDATILTNYEQFYIDQHNRAGFELLNLKMEAGKHGGHSEETKRLIGLKHKGKVISDEQRRNHSLKMAGRPSPRKGTKCSCETKLKISENSKNQINRKGPPRVNIPWNKGLKGAQVAYNKGVSPTQEVREKIRRKLLGSKLSPETIAKRTVTLKKNGVKRKWSNEAKKRQSERYLGKAKSAETIEKGRATRLLKKLNSTYAIS
jgi:group I intron endonuclease